MRRISKLFEVVVVVGLGSGCHPTGSGAERMAEPTLAVLGPDGIACAAVAVASDVAVTANHCAPERAVIYMTSPRERSAQTGVGIVVRRDSASDLAAFSAVGLVPAELARGPVDYERVTTMVAHFPEPWGEVDVHPNDIDAGFVLTERLTAGASGSGLWDENGRLIGVAIGNSAKFGYFAGSGRITHLLHEPPASPSLASEPPAAPVRAPAVWGDRHLSIGEMLDGAKKQSERIETRLRHLPAVNVE